MTGLAVRRIAPLTGQEAAAAVQVPLVVDLDGTLIRTDMLVESVLAFVLRYPLRLPLLFWWLLQGRAVLKHRLAEAIVLDVDRLPLREDVVAFVTGESARGRRVILATASHASVARRFAARLGCVDLVLASDGHTNLKGHRKAKTLTRLLPDGFDYVGDSWADMPVWAAARRAIFVGNSRKIATRLAGEDRLELSIPATRVHLRDWVAALRIHQWAKNALIFVPIILGGRVLEAEPWLACLLGFLGIGMVASATYVMNDLFDLADDRRHWSKCHRPLAAGRLPIPQAAAAALGLLLLGLAASVMAGGLRGFAMVALYLIVSAMYSMCMKSQPFADAIVLAGLFTVRLAFGIVLAQVEWSAWLLVFSMFLFTSLSFAKRATELARLAQHGHDHASGRGYLPVDGPAVTAFGISAGTAAVFVLVMYLIEEAFQAFYYPHPAYLWAFPLALALWLGRVWLLCGRGEMKDDPVVFAITDRTSLTLGLLMLAAAVAARIG